MLYAVLADISVFIHALFVLFAVFGGLAVLRWKRLVWAHLPAAVWGVAVELGGWVCPLTCLENHFRRLAGEAGYQGGFIERYLEPLLYPLGLTQRSQIFFGFTVLLINLVLYSIVWRRAKPGINN